MKEFFSLFFYTIFCAVLGSLFTIFVVLVKTENKPTIYILPDAPATGMYVSNNKFKF